MLYTREDFDFIDAHCHFFPPKLFKAIWNFFEKTDVNGNIQGWPINYKYPISMMISSRIQINTRLLEIRTTMTPTINKRPIEKVVSLTIDHHHYYHH